jgi:hypothetical protein
MSSQVDVNRFLVFPNALEILSTVAVVTADNPLHDMESVLFKLSRGLQVAFSM